MQHIESLLLSSFGTIIEDETITEISVNPDGRVWVERVGEASMQLTDLTLDSQTAKNVGQDLSGLNPISRKTPLAGSDFFIFNSLWRSQVVMEPVVEGQYTFSLRRNVLQNFSLDDLITGLDGNVIDQLFDTQCNPADQSVFEAYDKKDLKAFLKAAVLARWNIIFSGGTSSGKTTWLRACLECAPEYERILTIEDVRDIHAPHPNSISLKTNENTNSQDILKACLRLRPDRILMGEIRGAEAFDFLRAINSGHPGGITTLHATSTSSAMEALALMVMQADIGMNRAEIIKYCESMIDVVIQLNKVDGVRKPTEIKIFRKRV